jgi:outer membrane autotransporter protein
VSLVGGNSLELDVVGVASVNAAVAASAEEGFSFQNAVAGAQLSPRAAGSATPLWVRGVSEAGPAEGGVQQAINGVLFGGDVASFSGGALRLGVAGGYVSSDAQALVGSNSSAAEGLQAGTYGTYDLSMPGGATQLTFGLHGGYQTQETERAVVVGDTRTVGRGETRGSLMGGYVGASREFALGDHLTLRPGARLGYLHQELEGYRDSAGLRVGALSADSLRFGPQVELSGDYETAGGITFKPRGQVGWSQQMALDDRSVRLTLPSGAGGKVALDDGNAGSLNVAFGLDMVFTWCSSRGPAPTSASTAPTPAPKPAPAPSPASASTCGEGHFTRQVRTYRIGRMAIRTSAERERDAAGLPSGLGQRSAAALASRPRPLRP